MTLFAVLCYGGTFSLLLSETAAYLVDFLRLKATGWEVVVVAPADLVATLVSAT
jgi:hypothetical protein